METKTTQQEENHDEPSEPCLKCFKPLLVGIGGATRSGKTTLVNSLLLEPNLRVVKTIHIDDYFKEQQLMPVLLLEDKNTGRRVTTRNWELRKSIKWDEFMRAVDEAKNLWTDLCETCQSRLDSSDHDSTQPSSPIDKRNRRAKEMMVLEFEKKKQLYFREERAKEEMKNEENEKRENDVKEKKKEERKNESENQQTASTRPVIIVEGFLIFSHPPLVEILDKKLFISITKRVCKKRRMKTSRVSRAYFFQAIWPGYVKNNRHIPSRQDIYILDGDEPKEIIVEKTLTYLLMQEPLQLQQHADDSYARKVMEEQFL